MVVKSTDSNLQQLTMGGTGRAENAEVEIVHRAEAHFQCEEEA